MIIEKVLKPSDQLVGPSGVSAEYWKVSVPAHKRTARFSNLRTDYAFNRFLYFPRVELIIPVIPLTLATNPMAAIEFTRMDRLASYGVEAKFYQENTQVILPLPNIDELDWTCLGARVRAFTTKEVVQRSIELFWNAPWSVYLDHAWVNASAYCNNRKQSLIQIIDDWAEQMDQFNFLSKGEVGCD